MGIVHGSNSMPLFGAPEKLMNTSQDALNCELAPNRRARPCRNETVRTFFAHLFRMRFELLALALSMSAILNVGCARETAVYSDPSPPAPVIPVSTGGNALPVDFYNQSVNRASVELQPDGVSASSKALKFHTSSGTNDIGGFNGTETGNRAILALGSWHGRPVAQAEPITFDAQNFAGAESLGVTLQIDLACDENKIVVVSAAGAAIASESTTSAGDGYTRFTASFSKALWTASGNPVLNASDTIVLVPISGSRVSLSALLSEYPAACLKNAATAAPDLAKGIPTAAVAWTLGQDSTTSVNSVFVRRLTAGSEVFEGLE